MGGAVETPPLVEEEPPVRNADLWMELVGIHKTNWIWTKGHAAHEDRT
jgi:ribonuclease HI